jgi:hypothetical protein
MTCPAPTVAGGGAGGPVAVDRQVLIRTGGVFEANTPLNTLAPGAGWQTFGDIVTFSDATNFIEQTQLYRNGQLLLTATSSTADNDVYFVAASGTIAFESNLHANDVIQVWKFEATASG